jgi:cellulose synthase/poly-beta-1,6-N-acetylglucosamine synthase-like glycosyltransferase
MIFIFWVSLAGILYIYAGYPLILWGISRYFRTKGQANELKELNYMPSVSLLISAYNEEGVLEEKICNSLELDYPKEQFEIVVISDGSDDKTDEIALGFASSGVLLWRYEGRIGKTECLNNALPNVRGEIVIFSDANSFYDRNAIQELVKNFSNSEVGFVTGWTKYLSAKDCNGLVEPIGIYSRLEKFMKDKESIISSCVGADGAIFALRKELYRPLRKSDINDLVIPFTIIQQGFRGVFQSSAFCTERIAKNISGEFHRQVRITSRTIRAIVSHRKLLDPLTYGYFSLELFSHKVMKLFSPFFLLVCFFANMIAAVDVPLFRYFLLGQLAFYGLAVFHASTPPLKGILYIPRAFTVANGAILWGWLKYFNREKFLTWHTGR